MLTHFDCTIVIDMQPGMLNFVDYSVMANVIEEIKSAANANRPIIFIELTDYEATLAGLLTVATASKAEFKRVQRESSDGSQAVFTACAELGCPTVHFLVCGVFAHACVYDTVCGLTRGGSRVTVHKAACDDFIGDNWSRFEVLPGVALE